MELVGLQNREGIVMSWMPDGLSMEMSTYKVKLELAHIKLHTKNAYFIKYLSQFVLTL